MQHYVSPPPATLNHHAPPNLACLSRERWATSRFLRALWHQILSPRDSPFASLPSAPLPISYSHLPQSRGRRRRQHALRARATSRGRRRNSRGPATTWSSFAWCHESWNAASRLAAAKYRNGRAACRASTGAAPGRRRWDCSHGTWAAAPPAPSRARTGARPWARRPLLQWTLRPGSRYLSGTASAHTRTPSRRCRHQGTSDRRWRRAPCPQAGTTGGTSA